MSISGTPSRSCVVVTEFDGREARDIERLASLVRDLTPIGVVAVTSRLDLANNPSLRKLAAEHPHLSFLETGVHLGRGASLRAGFAMTTERYVAFVNLSGAVPAGIVTDALDELVETRHADGIIWNRFATFTGARSAFARRFRSGACNSVARTLFGLRVHDVHSPLLAFRRDVLETVFDRLRMYDHGFATDVLYNAKREGFTIIERPLRSASAHRHKHFVRDAASAALAIVALRLFYSPLRNVPLVVQLGAHYSLPVKRTYSIAIFCWRDPFSPKAGGGEVYLHEQAKWWVRQGCSVTWVSERFAGSRSEETLDGIRFVRRGRGLLVFAGVPLWHLFSSKRDYDFIIDVMNGIPFFTPLYSAKPKIALLYHLHAHHFRDELPWPLAQIATSVETKLVPFIYQRTRFVTISESTRRDMVEAGISKMPILTIQSGVSTDLVPGKKSKRPTILYLGRLRKYKRVRKLIDAFARIRCDVPDAQLIVAGSGDDSEPLQNYVATCGIEGVLFAGRVDEAEKLRLLQEAWVFGMPSEVEGWGIVVIEAAACATPSVAFNVNGLRDCIVDGSTGLLVDDDVAFEDGLRTLLVDHAKRYRFSVNALEWSSRFSWDRTAARTLERVRLAQPWRAVFEPNASQVWTLRERQNPVANGEVKSLADTELQLSR